MLKLDPGVQTSTFGIICWDFFELGHSRYRNEHFTLYLCNVLVFPLVSHTFLLIFDDFIVFDPGFLPFFQVGGSLYASNMGSEHFIGLAGSGAASGIGVVAYEWHASWILLLLGFFFVPIYIRSKIYTMPEYLRKRFQSKWMRIYLTVVSLISYITTKISVSIRNLCAGQCLEFLL